MIKNWKKNKKQNKKTKTKTKTNESYGGFVTYSRKCR